MNKEKISDTQNAYAVSSLEDIRVTIDTLDNKIHDLLIERSMLIERISEEKKKHNIQIAQPAREATMIRRLLARHKGPLPHATIIRIWRELVGAVTMLQTGLKVAVYTKSDEDHIWDGARDYFGGALPMERVSSVMNALVLVRDDKVNFAVLPWPELGERTPWWLHLSAQNTNLNIISALPYCSSTTIQSKPKAQALVVSKFSFASSGDDRSFLMLEIDSNTSRAKIFECAQKSGIKILNLYTHLDENVQKSQHLLEVEGYYKVSDVFEGGFLEKLSDPQATLKAIGGYPVPPM